MQSCNESAKHRSHKGGTRSGNPRIVNGLAGRAHSMQPVFCEVQNAARQATEPDAIIKRKPWGFSEHNRECAQKWIALGAFQLKPFKRRVIVSILYSWTHDSSKAKVCLRRLARIFFAKSKLRTQSVPSRAAAQIPSYTLSRRLREHS